MQNIFLGSNTPQGFYGFYAEQLSSAERVYILKGGPGTGKSTLIKKLAKRAQDEKIDGELWHCSGDPFSLDGIFLPERKTVVVDGTYPHMLEANLPGLKEQIVALGDHIDRGIIMPHYDEIKETLNRKKSHFNSAYCQINSAYCNLSAIYAPYQEAIKSDKLTQLATSICNHIRTAYPTRRQFSTALTPDGFVTYKDNLENKQIIALKASSLTITKKIISILQNMLCGFSAYHCSLEPELAEGLVVGRYAVIPFDDCVQPNDVIELDTALKVEVSVEEFIEEKKLYDKAIALAVRHLSDARDCHKKVEDFYISAMDFESINKKTAVIEEEIFG